MLKLVRSLFTIDKDHVFYLMLRSFHLLLVFGCHSFDGQKTINIHTNKFISWIPMIFTLTVCYSVLDNLVLSVEAYRIEKHVPYYDNT